MAYEFIARNGVIAQDDSQITGSLIVSDGITGSLFGTSSYSIQAATASYVTNEVTASYAVSASQALNSNNAISASYALTASYASNVPVTASFAISASYAATSSYASNFTVANTLTAQTLVVQTVSSSVVYSSGSNIFGNQLTNTQKFTGSVQITGSLLVNGPATINNLTGSLLGTASYATNALSSSYALNATNALTASYFVTSSVTSASFANFATSASQAGNTNTIDINSLASDVSAYLLFSNVIATPGVAIGGNASIRYNPVQNILTVGKISATSITGSLLGTSSYASQALSASYALNATTAATASYFLTSSVTSASFATSASYALSSSFASLANTASFVTTAQTASYVLQAVSASFATSASYARTSSFATTAATASYFVTSSVTSASFATSASYAATSSFASDFTVANTLTATTLVVQTVSSSVVYSSGSNIFGNQLTNTQKFTGSVQITGSLLVNGPATLNNLTGSLFGTASFATTAATASYFVTSSVTSASFATSASYALSASYAPDTTFPYTGSAIITGSLGVTGSVTITGSLGIGTTSLTNSNLNISKNITGGTVAYSALVQGNAQSDVTSNARVVATTVGTQAASFTLSNLEHFGAFQGTIGAGSSVGGQKGFLASSTLTGGGVNYGFQGQIPISGSSNWNLYMDGTAPNYMAGPLGIGNTGLTGFNFRVSKAISGSVSSYGVLQDGQVQSDVTSDGVGFRNNLNTQAASFNLTNYWHFWARQATIGAGSTITSQQAFYADSNLTGANNNYGFRGALVASGSSNYNLYMDGGAPNYLSGSTGIGKTPSTGVKLDVSGSAVITGSLAVEGGSLRIGDNAGNFTAFSFTGGTLLQSNNNPITFQGALRVNSTAGNSSYISGSGGLALGKTTATTTLDVLGNTLITGSLTLSSSAAVELNVIGNTLMTGSLNVTQGITGSLFGTASYATTAATASYFVTSSVTSASFATSSSYAATSSYASNFTVANTLTATTLVVQTVSSSVVYSSGSNIFGNSLSNTQTFTGSVNITGSLNLVGNQISSGSLTLFGPNNNTPNIKTQNSSLILEGNAGGFSSFGTQLRLTANIGAWADNVTSSYFQIKTTGSFGSNNYVTFQGGTWASDAPFDRLQFASYYTSFNNSAYGTTPIPTASVEIVNTNSGTIPLLQLKTTVGQTSNYVNITSGSTAGNVFNITKDGVVAIGTTNTSTEANLFLGAKGTDEGGQIILQKGTTQSSASMLDNYQNTFRVLTGNDTTSNRMDLELSHVTQNLRIFGDVIAYAASDKRLKENVQPIINALDKLDKIGGYTFDWDDKVEIHGHEGHDIGVIAQEIEEVLPEAVTTRDNGYKAVKYEKLTAFLIQVNKEQQQIIKNQQQQIDELKELINIYIKTK